MERRLRIGLLVDFLVSEYSEFLIEGVSASCKKMNADFYIFQMGQLRSLSKNFDYQCVAITSLISKNNIDGIIATSTTQTHNKTLESFVSYLKSYAPIPVVNISTEILGIPSIVVNYEMAFRSLVEHVVRDIGARKIAFMSAVSKSDEITLREKIFWQVIKEHNISPQSVKVWKATLSYSSAMYELTKKENQNDKFDYDAIICLNDDTALAVLEYVKKRGIKVPENLVITGFDNLRKSNYSIPSLSTVDQRVFQQGYVAARTLYDMLVGKKVPSVQEIEAKAILRQSTGAQRFFYKVRNNKFLEIDRAAIAGVSSSSMVYEWYQNRTQMFRMTKLFLEIQAGLCKEDILYQMTYNFHAFGISYVALVAFEHPIDTPFPFDYFHLPDRAKVICASNPQKDEILNLYDSPVYFNPNECMLPEQFLTSDQRPIFAMSLFSGITQMGYMLIEKLDIDIAVYDPLRYSVSEMLSALNRFEEQEKLRKQEALSAQPIMFDKYVHQDSLTGLLNRRGIIDFGNAFLDTAKEDLHKGLLIYCDLNEFEKINENFGHEAGDSALNAFSEILKSIFTNDSLIGRINADKFVILSKNIAPEDFFNIKDFISKASINWVEKNNSLFLISSTVVYVEFSSDTSYDLNELLKSVEDALQEEKAARRDSI